MKEVLFCMQCFIFLVSLTSALVALVSMTHLINRDYFKWVKSKVGSSVGPLNLFYLYLLFLLLYLYLIYSLLVHEKINLYSILYFYTFEVCLKQTNFCSSSKIGSYRIHEKIFCSVIFLNWHLTHPFVCCRLLFTLLKKNGRLWSTLDCFRWKSHWRSSTHRIHSRSKCNVIFYISYKVHQIIKEKSYFSTQLCWPF
jgi:hypothetical protein